MLSNDRNVESVAQLIEALKDYLVNQKEYVKLDIIDKIVRVATALALMVVLIIMGVIVLFYLSFAIVYWIAPATGVAWSFFIVAMGFLLLLLLVFYFRKPWIERPLVRFLAHTLLS